ncbi:MAG TPA: TIGR03826 family flagellar region protein [Chondromyces sp.]|nr:TIGR03826 family flagellar region protein [Chondromyces sp.]
MEAVTNCPRCGELFMKNAFREVCAKCAKEEEEHFNQVYRFLRKRENRAATIERIMEVTGVDEELIYKWVRKGRLHPAHFPNLGYPCDRCGAVITKGKMCVRCVEELQNDLEAFEKEEKRKEEITKRQREAYHFLNN